MGRGSDQANGAATSAQNLSNQSSANASALYGTLAPELESEMSNPSGINPLDLARMDTAAGESAGGSQAGAQGAGALRAARTGNVGGSDAAIASSTRAAGEIAARGVLSNRMKNAEVKQENKAGAERGLQGLYGANLGSAGSALGEVANNVNANTNAENASWDWSKYILDPLMSGATGMAAARLGK
jgi:hypothetical protein